MSLFQKINAKCFFAYLLLFFLLLSSFQATSDELTKEQTQAVAWLLKNQNPNGSWGDQSVAETSEALRALLNAGLSKSFSYAKGVSWLVNKPNSNVDTLSRKLITLKQAGHDVSLYAAKLKSVRSSNQTFNNGINGPWSTYTDSGIDFYSTSLAIEALAIARKTDSLVGESMIHLVFYQDYVDNGKVKTRGSNGWAHNSYLAQKVGGDIAVSAQVLTALATLKNSSWNGAFEKSMPLGTRWLLNQQKSSGAFTIIWANSDGAIQDTASSLIALEALRKARVSVATGANTEITKAKNYLKKQQLSNGSWGNSAYKTSLVLRTYPPVTPTDTDRDGIPNSVELQLGLNPNQVDDRLINSGNGTNTSVNALPILAEGIRHKSFVYAINTDAPMPFQVSLSGGSLPNGLTLSLSNNAWIIKGVPTKSGQFEFAISIFTEQTTIQVPGSILVLHENDHTTDTDNDGLSSRIEILNNLDPLNPDSDQDGLPDSFEFQYGLNAGINDAHADPDGDGMDNLAEYKNNRNPIVNEAHILNVIISSVLLNNVDPCQQKDTAWGNQDTDADGLSNLKECQIGTKFDSADSDNDGIPDGIEISNNLNPLDKSDALHDNDQDGVSNLEEYNQGRDISLSEAAITDIINSLLLTDDNDNDAAIITIINSLILN